MKILVTGFQRSGTTLLENLFLKHPDVKFMFHETVILARFENLEALYNAEMIPEATLFNKKIKGKMYRSKRVPVTFNLRDDHWGEKIPFWNPGLNKHGYKGKTLISYCKWWNDCFYPDSRIVYIVRHPADVALSTRKIGYNRNLRKTILKYRKAVPIVVEELLKFPNVIFVSYESLVQNPRKILSKLYKDCGLRHSKDVLKEVINSDIYWFGSINASRAFNYRKSNANFRGTDMKGVIRFLNNNLDVVNYKL